VILGDAIGVDPMRGRRQGFYQTDIEQMSRG
jgi:hypothetical protein